SPIYTRVMNDLGLSYSLKQQLQSATHDSVGQFNLPLGAVDASQQRSALARFMAQRISWLTRSESRYSALPNLTLGRPDQPPPTGRNRTLLAVQSLSGLEQHTRVVEGRNAKATDDPAN